MSNVFRKMPIAGIIVALMLCSCGAKTIMTDSWENPAYAGKAIKSVMVVCFLNDSRKMIVENAFARKFEEHGVKAITSTTIIPQGKPNREKILSEARTRGCETIFAIRSIESGHEGEERQMATPDYPPGGIDQGGLFADDFAHIYAPETTYVILKKFIKIECRLYDGTSEKLIWWVTSETIEPDSLKDLIHSLSNSIMNNLHKDKLIN